MWLEKQLGNFASAIEVKPVDRTLSDQMPVLNCPSMDPCPGADIPVRKTSTVARTCGQNVRALATSSPVHGPGRGRQARGGFQVRETASLCAGPFSGGDRSRSGAVFDQDNAKAVAVVAFVRQERGCAWSTPGSTAWWVSHEPPRRTRYFSPPAVSSCNKSFSASAGRVHRLAVRVRHHSAALPPRPKRPNSLGRMRSHRRRARGGSRSRNVGHSGYQSGRAPPCQRSFRAAHLCPSPPVPLFDGGQLILLMRIGRPAGVRAARQPVAKIRRIDQLMPTRMIVPWVKPSSTTVSPRCCQPRAVTNHSVRGVVAGLLDETAKLFAGRFGVADQKSACESRQRIQSIEGEHTRFADVVPHRPYSPRSRLGRAALEAFRP